jgi:hypothetical protein
VVLELLVGLALVGLGVRQWRRRGVPSAGADGWGSKKVFGRLDNLSPRGASVLGVLKQPWAITTAAAIFLARHHVQGLVTLIAFACFTVASTASVGLMYLFYARRPGEAEAYLGRLRDRAIASGPTVFAVAALLIGAFLVVDAGRDLAGS